MNRIIGFLLGLLIVALVASWTAKPSPAEVLPEHEGAIKTLAIQYTQDSAAVLWPAIEAFLTALSKDVEVIAVCGTEDDAASFPRDRLTQKRVHLIIVEAKITGWSKDRFLVAGDRLVCPRPGDNALQTRSNDSRVASAIQRRWPRRFRVLETPLAFDSGDILCTGDRALINDELRQKNQEQSNLEEHVQAFTGKQVITLPNSPRHHIGMFAAPIDEHTVVVGDPRLGERLWSDDATEQIGSPDTSVAAIQPFLNAAAELERQGFRVLRVPTAVIGPKTYVSYTNGVFEQRNGEKIVYMPAYGIPSLDDASARIFEGEGWVVKRIPVRQVFHLSGTIGCLVNILERG